jgi:hypothetical protein
MQTRPRPLSEIPTPAHIQTLPREQREYPVPVHVAWHGGRVRLQEGCPFRCAYLVHTRRCIICGLRIDVDELCWFAAESGVFRGLDSGVVAGLGVNLGGSHKECLLWATAVCPFLFLQGAARRSSQYLGDTLITERGTITDSHVLVGTSQLHTVIDPSNDPVFTFLCQPPYESIEYESGDEILPLLTSLVASTRRIPDPVDVLVVRELVSEDHDLFIERVRNIIYAAQARDGESWPGKPDRNSPCPCGSHAKYKRCCGSPRAGDLIDLVGPATRIEIRSDGARRYLTS